MSKKENDNEAVSVAEGQDNPPQSPLQALSKLIEEHHTLLAFSADTPITFAHPAISLVREAVRLGLLVLEEDAAFFRRMMEQFDAKQDGAP